MNAHAKINATGKRRALHAGRSSNYKHNLNMPNRRKGGENFFCPGGQRNSLKRLNPDKEIQGKQSLFLGKIWIRLGAAWPDFAGFGENLAALDRRAWRDWAESGSVSVSFSRQNARVDGCAPSSALRYFFLVTDPFVLLGHKGPGASRPKSPKGTDHAERTAGPEAPRRYSGGGYHGCEDRHRRN
jgi:hypothetical protein